MRARRGTTVTVMVYGRHAWTSFPRRRLPLRLGPMPVQHAFEGIPADLAFQRLPARVNGYAMEVFVVYGHTQPTRQERARAATMVARLTLR